MKKILRFTLILAFALITHNQIWQNLFFENNVITIIKVAVILAIFELLLKPIIKILLLPINLLTLGTIRIVINTLGLYLAIFLIGDFQVNNIFLPRTQWQGINIPQFQFQSFFAFLVSSLTISFILYIYNLILTKKIHKS